MTGMIFIPGITADDLDTKATVDAALADAIYWPSGTTTLCGIEVPGLLFALSASTALNPYPLALFGADPTPDGALWRASLASSVYDAHTGGAVADYGDGIGRIEDQSGNGHHLVQASTSLRPVFGRRPATGIRNRLTSSSTAPTLTHASVELGFDSPLGAGTAVRVTAAGTGAAQATFNALGFAGTGRASIYIKAGPGGTFARFASYISGATWAALDQVNLTTGETGPSLTAEDAGDGWWRVSPIDPDIFTNGGTVGAYIVTDMAGTYGTVGGEQILIAGPQLELGAVTPTQIVAAGGRDVTEPGVPSVTYAVFDLVDDALVSGAIAGGVTGQALVAGDGGLYITDLDIADGGGFWCGGTSHNWTGAAPGILKAVTGATGRMLDAMIRDGSFTEAEITRLERLYIAQGGKGLLVPDGVELVTNGGFDVDTDWTKGGGWSISGGSASIVASAGDNIYQTVSVVPDAYYVMECDVVSLSGGIGMFVAFPVAPSGISPSFTATGRQTFIWRNGVATSTGVGFRTANGASCTIDNISVQRLIPREDL